MINRLSKRVILIPMLLISTPAVATAFIKYYILYHRFPKVIINDKGTQFTNAVWAIIYRILRIERHPSSTYHPEIKGLQNA